jgi:hypothetical protein
MVPKFQVATACFSCSPPDFKLIKITPCSPPSENKVSLTSPLEFLFEPTLHLSLPSLSLSLDFGFGGLIIMPNSTWTTVKHQDVLSASFSAELLASTKPNIFNRSLWQPIPQTSDTLLVVKVSNTYIVYLYNTSAQSLFVIFEVLTMSSMKVSLLGYSNSSP